MALNKTQHFDVAPRQDFGIHKHCIVRGPCEYKGGGCGVKGGGGVDLQQVAGNQFGEVRRERPEVFQAGMDRKNSQGGLAHRLPGASEVYRDRRKNVKGNFRNPKNRRS